MEELNLLLFKYKLKIGGKAKNYMDKAVEIIADILHVKEQYLHVRYAISNRVGYHNAGKLIRFYENQDPELYADQINKLKYVRKHWDEIQKYVQMKNKGIKLLDKDLTEKQKKLKKLAEEMVDGAENLQFRVDTALYGFKQQRNILNQESKQDKSINILLLTIFIEAMCILLKIFYTTLNPLKLKVLLKNVFHIQYR